MVRFHANDLYPIQLSIEEEIRLIKYAINLKKQVLTMITKANSGHPGGSLSSTEILTCLYEKILVHDPKNPEDPKRDRFILSKGHCAPALYALLGLQGYFDIESMGGLRQYKSKLQGHPKKGLVPGIEISTGSLGQGLSNGIGMALAAKLDHHINHTYVLLGDGECEEGAVWEAAMAASHFNVDNLIAIIDRNALQLDGTTEKVMSVEPFSAKWEAFGWNVIEIDGTSIREILMALNTAKLLRGKPVMIISYMIKGQGVSFMQHVKDFHGKPPSKSEYERAIKDLEEYQQKQIARAQECAKNAGICFL